MAILVFGCAKSGPPLTEEQAAQMITEKMGAANFVYVSFTGIKADSELGKYLKNLIDTGVFVSEAAAGEAKEEGKESATPAPAGAGVFKPKDSAETAQYAQGNIEVGADGTMAASLAVNKVVLDKVSAVVTKKKEATAKYMERLDPTALSEIVMADPEAKAAVEQAKSSGTIPTPAEKEAQFMYEKDAWKMK
jgi:hypothetical protein